MSQLRKLQRRQRRISARLNWRGSGAVECHLGRRTTVIFVFYRLVPASRLRRYYDGCEIRATWSGIMRRDGKIICHRASLVSGTGARRTHSVTNVNRISRIGRDFKRSVCPSDVLITTLMYCSSSGEHQSYRCKIFSHRNFVSVFKRRSSFVYSITV